MSIIQDLYDSEINFQVETFFDSGFHLALGDRTNGWLTSTTVHRWGNVEPWLLRAAIEHYPDSLIALMYRDGMSRWQAEKELQRVSALKCGALVP